MSQENVDRLQDMYGRRTLPEFAASLHPEAELHQEPSIPDATNYYGRDEFVRGMVLWLEEWEAFRYTPEKLVDLGDAAFVRVALSGRAKASGVELDQTVFHVWTFRDGMPWRCRVYFDEARRVGRLKENLEISGFLLRPRHTARSVPRMARRTRRPPLPTSSLSLRD
jgi:ketosteroid isomerase-like protein